MASVGSNAPAALARRSIAFIRLAPCRCGPCFLFGFVLVAHKRSYVLRSVISSNLLSCVVVASWIIGVPCCVRRRVMLGCGVFACAMCVGERQVAVRGYRLTWVAPRRLRRYAVLWYVAHSLHHSTSSKRTLYLSTHLTECI